GGATRLEAELGMGMEITPNAGQVRVIAAHCLKRGAGGNPLGHCGSPFSDRHGCVPTTRIASWICEGKDLLDDGGACNWRPAPVQAHPVVTRPSDALLSYLTTVADPMKDLDGAHSSGPFARSLTAREEPRAHDWPPATTMGLRRMLRESAAPIGSPVQTS